MSSMAEKFQITVSYSEKKDDDGTEWVDVKSAQVSGDTEVSKNGSKFNVLPSSDIFDQYCENGNHASGRLNNFAAGFGGNTDVSNGLSAKALKDGFDRKEMKSTDDQYSGEHIDLFYGEVCDEKGNESFVERNNYLDRL
jgi:hypothetical protein